MWGMGDGGIYMLAKWSLNVISMCLMLFKARHMKPCVKYPVGPPCVKYASGLAQLKSDNVLLIHGMMLVCSLLVQT